MTHQAHGSSTVRAHLTGEIEFHTAFDIKSLPSTNRFGWVEKIFKHQQWGPQEKKVLNTHCPHLKHYLGASAWVHSRYYGYVCFVLTTVLLRIHHALYLTPTSCHCKLHTHCLSPQDTPSTTTPHLIFCVPSPSAVSQYCFTCCWARRSTWCSAGYLKLSSWPEDVSCLKAVRGHLSLKSDIQNN